jgi:hypothetical protein
MPSKIADRLKFYGRVPIENRVDIVGRKCVSLDLRATTGGHTVEQDAWIIPPHPFRVSVFGETPDEPPTAEVRFMIGDREYALVGALTGREGVNEVTPEHLLTAAIADEEYAAQLRAWGGPVAK